MDNEKNRDIKAGLYENMKYGGFFRRSAAAMLDLIVVLPLLGVLFWAVSNSKTAALIVYLPFTGLMLAYRVYFNGRWGQTLGKRALGLKIVRVDGTAIGYKTAIVRDSVAIAISLISGVVWLAALMSLPGAEFDVLKFSEKYARIMAAMPSWGNTFNAVSNWWFLPEAMVLLFNAKRRAVRDFIAGTVVICVENSAKGS